MKKMIFSLLSLAVLAAITYSCKFDAIDDNGLLITTRGQCYMAFFDLLGTDNNSVLASKAAIDTVALTVTGVAKFGTNLKHVKPYCSLVTDAILEPAMGQWVDFTAPRQYTVVSGNRKVKKVYTITVTLQQ